MDVIVIILIIFAAYLLGSIPSAVWIGKRFFGVDIREHGSKNAGATNTMRVLGRKAAAPVFIIDAGKGYAAVMLSFLSEPYIVPYSEQFIYLRIALIMAVIIGHIFPIFAGFRGGKGVATMAGCMIAMAPFPLLCSFTCFTVVLMVTHYVSLGSIIGALLFPLFVYLKFIVDKEPVSPTLMGFAVLVAAILMFMHRKNFKRIINGTESKIYPFKFNRNSEK